MEQSSFYSAIAFNEKIDADKGIIFGVSVMTTGEAKGGNSGTWIDHTTLSQFQSVASTFKDGIKVKLSMSKEHDGSIGQVCGTLKAFRIDGKQLRADLHLLKSDENFSKIVEMAQLMPEAFGLSAVVPKNFEKKDGKQYLRIEDIFSTDLVESPATNAGLFSAKEPMSDHQIKYAKGDSGEHHHECDCKECMSKHSKKMSAEDIAEITVQLSGAIKTAVDAQTTALTAKLTEVEAKLAKHDENAAAAALSAKKTEIAGLVSDATREGKVVPLTDVQLAKMDIVDIKEMFSKLSPNQVKLSGKRQIAPPKAADGKPLVFDKPEDRVRFCQEKQAEGAARLTADFLADSNLGLTRN